MSIIYCNYIFVCVCVAELVFFFPLPVATPTCEHSIAFSVVVCVLGLTHLISYSYFCTLSFFIFFFVHHQ